MVNAWLTQAAATTATTQPAGDASTAVATDAFVQTAIAGTNGFLGQNGPWLAMCGGATGVLASGTIYCLRVPIYVTAASGTRTINYNIATAGATLTANQNLVAAYSSTGAQLGSTSADQSTTWTSTGPAATTVGTFAVTSGTIIYVMFLSVGTTCPKFSGIGSGSNGTQLANVGLTGASLVASRQNTGQTTMPASIVPASLSTSSAQLILVGIT